MKTAQSSSIASQWEKRQADRSYSITMKTQAAESRPRRMRATLVLSTSKRKSSIVSGLAPGLQVEAPLGIAHALYGSIVDEPATPIAGAPVDQRTGQP